MGRFSGSAHTLGCMKGLHPFSVHVPHTQGMQAQLWSSVRPVHGRCGGPIKTRCTGGIQCHSPRARRWQDCGRTPMSPMLTPTTRTTVPLSSVSASWPFRRALLSTALGWWHGTCVLLPHACPLLPPFRSSQSAGSHPWVLVLFLLVFLVCLSLFPLSWLFPLCLLLSFSFVVVLPPSPLSLSLSLCTVVDLFLVPFSLSLFFTFRFYGRGA